MNNQVAIAAFATTAWLAALGGVMPAAAQGAGGTGDTNRATPESTSAAILTERDKFVAASDRDIAAGKATIVDLEKRASEAGAEVKAKMQPQITALRADVKSAEAKLAVMKDTAAARWIEFEADVSEATAHLRRSIQSTTG